MMFGGGHHPWSNNNRTDEEQQHLRFRGEEELEAADMQHNLVRHFNEPTNIMMPGMKAPLYAHEGAIELLTLEKMTGVEKLRRKQARKSGYKLFQIKTFNLLERPSNSGALFYHGTVFVLILASLFLSVLITIPLYESDDQIQNAVYFLEVGLVVVFSVEYILRVWSCSCHGNYTGFWGKARFVKKPYMVIDIIVIVATTVVVATQREGSDTNLLSVSMFRFLRFLQVLRILRLDRQRGAFKIVSNVIYAHRQELLTCWYMSFILLVACSFLVYLAEKGDDKQGGEPEGGELNNLGDGLYWGVITLSTVGYGDFSPKNWVAKLITCIFAFIGTAFFALPAGILGSGFALQVAQNQKQKHFNRRRVPAALVIQYAWRTYAAHPSRSTDATWAKHQVVLNPPKEKKFSVYTRTNNSPSQTPTTGRRSMAFIRKKLNASRINSYMEGDTLPSRRSSIGATIPTALELRDRCQSEGNLLLVSPNNVEDHQATIVSLPPQHFMDEGFFGNQDTINGHGQYFQSNLDVQLQPLMEREKDCIRFIRKTKLFIYIRKFKEECRPYDVKDVIEQYTEGQLELFSFIKKFQYRTESVLGIKEEQSFPPEKALTFRVANVERKVDAMDAKLDAILRILVDGKTSSYEPGGGGHPPTGDNFSNGTGSTEINIPMGDSNFTSVNDSRCDSIDNLQDGEVRAARDALIQTALYRRRATTGDIVHGTLESGELTRRLERLKSESSNNGDVDVKRRTESRFTITPSFLTPEPFVERTTAIDIDKPVGEGKRGSVLKVNSERPRTSSQSPILKETSRRLSPPSSSNISNMKKYQSAPNLQKQKSVSKDDEVRRSSFVTFDESSFIKHCDDNVQNRSLPVYEDSQQNDRTTACGNAYVSDIEDSDSNSSKTSTPKETSPHQSRDNISPSVADTIPTTNTGNDVTIEDATTSNSRESILERYGLSNDEADLTKETDNNRSDNKKTTLNSALSEPVLTSTNQPGQMTNGHASKSLFELNC